MNYNGQVLYRSGSVNLNPFSEIGISALFSDLERSYRYTTRLYFRGELTEEKDVEKFKALPIIY